MGNHGAPRLPGFAYRGIHIYSVTCCTFERTTWFTEGAVVDALELQLRALTAKWSFDASVYCFMPDHVHLVLEGTTEISDLRRLMDEWKQRTGFLHERDSCGRLWQPGYYDHVLRDESNRLGVIAYVVENPVRAGLVQCAEEYPFWGSSIWTRAALLEAIQGHTPIRGW
jgi:putative transposase